MAKAMEIDIGIGGKDRQAIADGLSSLLADTYTLYLKTHNFHWNVTGPMFNTLHLMFETQYTELGPRRRCHRRAHPPLGHRGARQLRAVRRSSASIKEEPASRRTPRR